MSDPIWTCVVTGPRGAGKSILVKELLEEQPRVVHIFVSGDDQVTEEVLAEKVMQKLKLPMIPHGMQC